MRYWIPISKKLNPISKMAEQVVLGWQLSTAHGWGVYGLNLALNWASDPQIESATSRVPHIIDIDLLRARAIVPFKERSLELDKMLRRYANGRMNYDGTFLAGLQGDFQQLLSTHNVTIVGKPSIGIIFFENRLSPEALERAKDFPCIVTGSTWNERILRAYNISGVRRVLQGIDPTLFHPGPKGVFFKDRFLIFSGGKAEYRKAQDIVLAAFKIFSKRHPEAVLVTTWQNMWPNLIQSLDRSGLLRPVVINKSNQIDVYGWANANEIPTDRILDLGYVPNYRIPTILREMNVALFPNRAEGGTNLVAMECMACGLPVILSRNTGHVDIIQNDSCYTLDDQRHTLHGFTDVGGVSGWGESQVDEVVERLEQVFFDATEAAQRGRRAAERLSPLTWQSTAGQMKDIIMEFK
jgi:glycosyltransferase involved in cell wall biosynthesis